MRRGAVTTLVAAVLLLAALAALDRPGGPGGPDRPGDVPRAGEAGPTAPERAQRREQTGPGAGELRRVLRVVDGDTVEVAGHGSVRVIGIDTPETVSPATPDECWGARASAAARRLLLGRRVAVVADLSQGRRDRYGRTLAYLDMAGRRDFGLAMVRAGHAAEFTYAAPYARQRRYQRAEAAARAARRGLWGRCGGPDVPLGGSGTR